MKERKTLLEDAKAATQAALEEESSRAAASPCFAREKAIDKLSLEGDEALGARIVRNSLQQPARFIAENAGVDGGVVVNRIRNAKSKNEVTTPISTSTAT